MRKYRQTEWDAVSVERWENEGGRLNPARSDMGAPTQESAAQHKNNERLRKRAVSREESISSRFRTTVREI